MTDYNPTANQSWLKALREVVENGDECSPRGMPIRERIGFQTVIDMDFPVVTIPERKMGFKFLFAEAWWILSGRKDVGSIAPYAPMLKRFTNDGFGFDGAYGPMVVEQLRFVVDSLVSDTDTRQAVMTVWRPNPRPSKDIPCTVALQFLIRNGHLHANVTMRSSDLWLGWVYDVFNFSMIARLVRELYHKQVPGKVEMGQLTLTAGSQHVYMTNYEGAKECMNFSSPVFNPSFRQWNFGGDPETLIARLDAAKDDPSRFLKNLEQ